LHALSGEPQHKAIQVRALVKNQALVILIDSDSSHTFLNSAIARKLQVAVTLVSAMPVKVANGALLTCSVEVKELEWWMQGHTCKMDANIIDIGAYDLVMGIDWFEQFSPMTCDWMTKWIEFTYNQKVITLQGIISSPPQQLQEVSVGQVIK
jgi:hypothetical protein